MKSKTLNCYLGWDAREQAAYDVARNSIIKRTKEPIKIIPLKLGHIDFFTRPIERRDGKLWCPISEAPMSTEFAISRFAVPFLQDTGWALFGDCDIICWSDINELFALADDKYAVMVVKHHQKEDPRFQTYSTESLAEYKRIARKMDAQIQTSYPRKNWSSVVLWNCDHPSNKRLTLEVLNTWPGRDLHAFKWLEDSEIGELPQKWNWLVNVTPGEPQQKGIWHYTNGGPWFEKWQWNRCDDEWLVESSNQKPKEAVLV